MPDIKEQLISPFSLVPSSSYEHVQPRKKEQRSFPFHLCKCDSDEENDFGMAPECVFYCAYEHHSNVASNKTTKKRKHGVPHVKKTRKSPRTSST